MQVAFLPGSFDPLTLGHLALIERASRLFSKLYVGIPEHSTRNISQLLTVHQRIDLLKTLTRHCQNVEIITYSGLTVECAKNIGATLLVRGVRNEMDYEEEATMAQSNRKLGHLETCLLIADPETSHIRASVVREILAARGPLEAFLPPQVIALLIHH